MFMQKTYINFGVCAEENNILFIKIIKIKIIQERMQKAITRDM
jgi:hypothetical protein